jgi:hypothetical protein
VISPAGDPRCPSAGTGAIGGTAHRAEDGAPLPTGTVRIYNESRCLVRYGSAPVAAGEWVVEGLAAGWYYVTIAPASEPGVSRVGMLYPDVVCPKLGEGVRLDCGAAGGRLVEVREGQTTPGIGFSVPQGARISGRVLDASSGQPVARPVIEVRQPEDERAIRYFVGEADGTYSAAGLAGGTYLLSASSDVHSAELYGGVRCSPRLAGCRALGESVTVTLGEVRTAADFQLDGLGAVEGTILDDVTRAPLAGVRVEAYAIGDPSGSHGAETDGAGRFRLQFLSAERYYIVAGHEVYRQEVFPGVPFGAGVQHGSLVQVLPERTAAGIDFELTRLGSIGGRVKPKDPPQRLERCTLFLWKVGDNGWDPGPSHASCGEDGTYLATGLEAGAYRVAVDLAYPARNSFLPIRWRFPSSTRTTSS